MTVVSFFCLFISLVLITPYCFGLMPNHEKHENCTDAIEFETWDEFMVNKQNNCIGENITKTQIVNLSIELDRILNIDQSRNVIEISLLSNFKAKLCSQ